MPFGLPSGGVNMQWLVDLINSMRGGAAPGGSPGADALAGLPGISLDRWGPSTPMPGRGSFPQPIPQGAVGDKGFGRPGVIGRMIQRPAGPASTGLGRLTEAMPAPVQTARPMPGLAPAPVAPETDMGPSPNEPPIPEAMVPESEPTGDAATWESALQNPDLLRQAEGGQMTSLDLLKALLERRAQNPKPGGGLQ